MLRPVGIVWMTHLCVLLWKVSVLTSLQSDPLQSKCVKMAKYYQYYSRTTNRKCCFRDRPLLLLLLQRDFYGTQNLTTLPPPGFMRPLPPCSVIWNRSFTPFSYVDMSAKQTNKKTTKTWSYKTKVRILFS